MRIAINTRFLLPHKMEGFGRFTYEVAKRLVALHPEHEFYFFFDRAFDSKFVFEKNVIPVVLNPPARHPILFKIWFNWSVTRALKKYRIDLFFSPDGYLSLRTDVPQIAVIHDLNFEHFPEDIPLRPRKYLKVNFPLFAKKAKHIITVSEFSKQDIVDNYNIESEKISVAYNGASPIFKPQSEQIKNEIKKEHSEGKSYFVYVGAIHARKNVQRLIEAFKQFKNKTNSETKLLIVGEATWKTLEIDNNIKDVLFTGHVEIEKLTQIVGSAKALCLVSYFEGFGIPLVEAMQSGVPVLSGNLTALPEVCGKAGLLVDPYILEEISKGLEQLDSDDSLRSEMIELGFKQVETFSWDASVQVISKVLFP
ncbi:MAG: glycosyltransferase family 4 protein [Crocinitomicaceae bacterium]